MPSKRGSSDIVLFSSQDPEPLVRWLIDTYGLQTVLQAVAQYQPPSGAAKAPAKRASKKGGKRGRPKGSKSGAVKRGRKGRKSAGGEVAGAAGKG